MNVLGDREQTREAYINVVKDGNGDVVCYKFGIAKDAK